MTDYTLSLYQKAVTNLVVIILAFNLVSCTGAYQTGALDPYAQTTGYVETVRWTAVSAGMREALMGNIRSLIMFNENNQMVMFAWPRAGGWSWIVLDSTMKSAANALHAAGGSGNLMSCSDFSCLMAGAEKIGYRQVTATDLLKLAPGFCNSIMQQTAAFAASAMTSVFVLPAGSIPSDPFAETVQ